jgi:hypothetical protein
MTDYLCIVDVKSDQYEHYYDEVPADSSDPAIMPVAAGQLHARAE